MLSSITLFGIHYQFSAHQTGAFTAFILLIFFGLFSTLETLFPQQKLPKTARWLSYKTNISLFIFNSTVLSLLSVSALFSLAQHYSHQGLLRYLSNPIWQGVLAFILLDLLLYIWHKACHIFGGLWLFHRIHHNDPYLNTSTAFRVHILELLLTNLLKALYIVVLGVDQLMVLVNEAIMAVLVMFHHSNMAFKGEHLLARVIIVPVLHRLHHSTLRHEHDSNYGTVLSLWDRLFGTLRQQRPIAIGIKGQSPQDAIGLIRFGFTAFRATPLPVNLDDMIAEAAYYKAEKRNFSPGYELLDWLEAKKEIIKLISQDAASSQYRQHQFN